jgi:hypothetical protein
MAVYCCFCECVCNAEFDNLFYCRDSQIKTAQELHLQELKLIYTFNLVCKNDLDILRLRVCLSLLCVSYYVTLFLSCSSLQFQKFLRSSYNLLVVYAGYVATLVWRCALCLNKYSLHARHAYSWVAETSCWSHCWHGGFETVSLAGSIWLCVSVMVNWLKYLHIVFRLFE